MITTANAVRCQSLKNTSKDSKRTPTHPHVATGLMTPTSPPYPPYASGFIDPAMYEHLVRGNNNHEEQRGTGTTHYVAHHPHVQQQPAPAPPHVQAAAAAAAAAGHGHHHHHHQPYQTAYVYPDVYPMSPQFQYYSDGSSYPGSPAIHPQSPPVNPTSPPFSPPFQYSNITLSPPLHAAYMIPPPHHFPPLHISSPILTGAGSPPHHLHMPSAFSLDKRHQEDFQYHTHNVYVRGLAESITDETFEELCKEFGTIVSTKAMIDQKTGLCKGYGFAMYEKEEDCEKAINGLNKKGLQASFARVGQESFSSRLKSLQDEGSTNIYISNLPLDMTEQKLEALFHPYKTVSNRILRDPRSGISRGVGFARLSDRPSALAIIEKFNGHTVDGSSAPLQVRFADSPAQKKLKSQTARKKMFRSPREFQPMTAGFPQPLPGTMAASIAAVATAAGAGARPMPITPEAMLGMAPVGEAVHYADPSQSMPQATPKETASVEPSSTTTTKEEQAKDNDVDDLITETKQKLNVSCD
ncbi:meiotic rna-binding protein 1 [Lichtheimia corymbifera JMRC:FSU:9682]|uniref:Meiotic rna-binding protein 1 n=1 Tax=Lichtheimia corymbifera JMRC:FSU:9682 TaxID=1263082 RepID=A0A068RH28_9FUNG|nr:meiotic rna-binding protein 1 [Lichtheimia corymbifera JMRC:FSU:9682]